MEHRLSDGSQYPYDWIWEDHIDLGWAQVASNLAFQAEYHQAEAWEVAEALSALSKEWCARQGHPLVPGAAAPATTFSDMSYEWKRLVIPDNVVQWRVDGDGFVVDYEHCSGVRWVGRSIVRCNSGTVFANPPRRITVKKFLDLLRRSVRE